MALSLDRVAHQAVLMMLADAHDHFSTLAQIAFKDKRDVEMEGNTQYAEWALRAYRAELDDRPSPRPTLAPCGACLEERCDGCRMCRTLGRPT